ncbi:hypothetical protein [Candidatus Solirubrobacter pratensis]|uniref:hypothetical protein n=1 Tax=Candidatus Solirubrobacter pratensis TaxID=1298857 RepID=UPI000485C43F|nr:hypothetical protein [Candidatus Solirubrobacter pratensis]
MSKVEITDLEQTCWACPSQWEGKLADGRHVYIRYRWGFLRVTVGATMNDAIKVGSSDLMAHVRLHRWFEEGLIDNEIDSNARLFEREVERIRAEAEDGEYIYGEQVGDDLDGDMSTIDMLDRLRAAGVLADSTFTFKFSA